MAKRNAKRSTENSNLIAGYYVVAFVDLLGQQGHLGELNGLPDKANPQEMQGFVQALKNTYGVVTGMRRNFSKFFSAFTKEDPRATQLTLEQRVIYRQLTSEPIKFQSFSDSAIAYLPIRTDRFKLPCRGIFGVLGASASTLLVSLAAGHPVRGGVDLGIGLEISKGEIYGSALARAHALESKAASYPRIVVGQELVTYLTLTAQQRPHDIYSEANKEVARICLDLLHLDKDGCTLIDFLGAGFKEHMTHGLNAEVVQLCYRFVNKELGKHKADGNEKLLQRYLALKEYVESRLPLWL